MKINKISIDFKKKSKKLYIVYLFFIFLKKSPLKAQTQMKRVLQKDA